MRLLIIMDVFLVRHAKSLTDWSTYPTDSVRPLAKKGQERQRKASKGMQQRGMAFDVAWVSPYQRAQETLTIIQDVFNANVPVEIVNELIPGGDEEKVLELLQRQAKKTPLLRLLVVTHNPLVSNLVELIDAELMIDMETSAVAHCSITEQDYKLLNYYSRAQLLEK